MTDTSIVADGSSAATRPGRRTEAADTETVELKLRAYRKRGGLFKIVPACCRWHRPDIIALGRDVAGQETLLNSSKQEPKALIRDRLAGKGQEASDSNLEVAAHRRFAETRCVSEVHAKSMVSLTALPKWHAATFSVLKAVRSLCLLRFFDVRLKDKVARDCRRHFDGFLLRHCADDWWISVL